jgi:hypothetical protein
MKYSIDGVGYENGRAACGYAWDLGYLPNKQIRPQATDKFNPIMLLQTAAANGCNVLVNGKKIEPNGGGLKTPKQTSNNSNQEKQPMQDNNKQAASAAELLQQAMQMLAANTTQTLDEGKVIELIKQHATAATVVEIKKPNLPNVNVGITHKKFSKLLRAVAAKVNVMLVGEAGSGKSSAAKKVAKALGKPFYFTSVGVTTTKYEFNGFIDANGRVTSTSFRKAWEEGGVFLIDEFDAASPNVAIALNEALANRRASFPDGDVDAHEDFICIAAANTAGTGATLEFSGRQRLDGATLDRFVFMQWDIDPEFELAIAPNKEWCKKVQKFRQIFRDLKIKQFITPRATIDGAKLLAADFPEKEVIDMTIIKGLGEDTRKQILARV